MRRSKNNFVVLLTGTICPNSHDLLSVKDPEVRRSQYVDAISFYLENTDYNIVFAENSGTSLKESFEEHERLEFLTFTSPYTIPERGKGWKELEIINFCLKNSRFIHSGISVLKITGRLKILNIKKIGKQINSLKRDLDSFVMCNVYERGKMDCRCFLFSTDFWPFLEKNGQSIQLKYSLERALWRAVCEYDLSKSGKYFQFTQPLKVKGISGGLGLPYNHSFVYTTMKKIKHLVISPWVYKKWRKKYYSN